MAKITNVPIELKVSDTLADTVLKLSKTFGYTGQAASEFQHALSGLGTMASASSGSTQKTLTMGDLQEAVKKAKLHLEQHKSKPLTQAELDYAMAMNLYGNKPKNPSKPSAIQVLAAVVYCAGGSVEIPYLQLEEAHFLLGGKYGSPDQILTTPTITALSNNGWEMWSKDKFEVEIMPNPHTLNLTVFSKMKEYMGFDQGKGDDFTAVALVAPEPKFTEHTQFGNPIHTHKVYMGVEPGNVMVKGSEHNMDNITETLGKAFSKGYFSGKKETILSAGYHWLLVGGPRHGETFWTKDDAKILKLETISPLIPKGVSSEGKSPMLMATYTVYHAHVLVANGARYRIGAQSEKDFNSIPFNEFEKYIEEVGLTPYDHH